MFFSQINYINCILVFENLLAGMLLCSIYDKRSKFWLRAIPTSLVAMTIGYFFPIWSTTSSMIPNVFYWLFMYLFLLMITYPVILFLYKIDAWSALVVTLVSYMVHHTNNVLHSNIMDSINACTNLSVKSQALYTLVNCMLYFAVITLVYGIFFIFYFKQRKLHIKATFHSTQILIFGMAVVFITIVFSSCIRLYYYIENTQMVFMMSMWQNFVSCLVIWMLYYNILRYNHMEQELTIEERLWEERKKQYELSKENIEGLNIKFHDLKYRIQMLVDANNGITASDMADIQEGLGIYDSIAKTGNNPLDIVISEYALRCEHNQISFTSIADGKALDFMSPYDVYTLFGNAITNAIEAVMKLDDKDKREISLVIKKKNDILLIVLENYFDKKPIKRDKSMHIISSKNDKSIHGFGTRSMFNIVERYKGTINTQINDDIYTLTIAFYLPVK